MARRMTAHDQRRQDALTRPSDEELRLVLHGDQHEPTPVNNGQAMPVTSASEGAPLPSDVHASADSVAHEESPLEAANRARILALHQLRSPAPVDFRDTFFGGLWVVLIFVPSGVAASVFLQLGIGWAAGVAFLVGGLGGGLAVGALERRDRKLLRELEKGIVSPPPRPSFHWKSITPAALVFRMGADLDALNVDDSALEDELEPLYEHGNKMDNGFSGGWR